MMSSLICIHYPHQLLPAIVAVLCYRRIKNIPSHQSIICIYADKNNHNNDELIKKMTSHFPYLSFLNVSKVEKKILFSSKVPIAKRAKLVKRKLNNYLLSELFYDHDITSDFIAQVFMQAFPHSERVCYGDSLGIVYTRQYFESLLYSYTNSSHFFRKILDKLRDSAAKLKRFYLSLSSSRLLEANCAVLMIPCDPGGDFLNKKQLFIPSLTEVTEVASLIQAGLPELSKYVTQLISSINTPCYFFVLSNFTESKLTSRENEIKLYKEIINKAVKKNSTVIIRLHPGSNESMFHLLSEELRNDYKLILFDLKYNVVPLELIGHFLRNLTVIALSYTSISLFYLHKIETIHALTDELIKRFMNPNRVNWMLQGNKMYIQVKELLRSWAGDTLLYSGDMSNKEVIQ